MQQITGRQIARNAAINLVGLSLVGVVSLVAIPITIRQLGEDAFGILSLVLAVLGYFSLFDLGLGRATTKFAAECLADTAIARLPRLVWTSVAIQLSLGVLGGSVLAASAPFLVKTAFNIPAVFSQDARLSILVIAATLPVVLATSALRGTLEAAQRFDLVNLIKMPTNAVNFVIPAVAVLSGARLPAIVFLLSLARVMAALAYLYLCCKLFPSLRERVSFDRTILSSLVSYGSWVTISSIISPVLVHLDRFLIGSLVSMTAVAYYAVPYDLANNFLIFPTALVSTLFPAFSTLGVSGDRRQIQHFYTRSLKFMLLGLCPLMLVLGCFATDILRLWLGEKFAMESAQILQILAVGVTMNSLGWIPLSLLQGTGRPDIPAKFHIVELPIYAGLAWVLIRDQGVVGAALAWTFRVALDALLLFAACSQFRLVSVRNLFGDGLPQTVLAVFALTGTLSLSLLVQAGTVVHVTLVVLVLALFGTSAWFVLLDATERRVLTSAAGAVFGKDLPPK